MNLLSLPGVCLEREPPPVSRALYAISHALHKPDVRLHMSVHRHNGSNVHIQFCERVPGQATDRPRFFPAGRVMRQRCELCVNTDTSAASSIGSKGAAAKEGAVRIRIGARGRSQ